MDTLDMNKEHPIVVKAVYKKPASKVWEAITRKEEMVQWYFEQIEAFEPTPGFETSFTVISGDRTFVHLWRVTEVEEGRKISYEWLYPDFPGQGLVSFELSAEANQTELTLSCWGIESFPQDIPEFSRESCKNGWKYFIQQRLAEYLLSKGDL